MNVSALQIICNFQKKVLTGIAGFCVEAPPIAGRVFLIYEVLGG